MRVALCVCTLSLLLCSVTAWWCNGHMITAQVAKLTMDPDVVQQVDDVFKQLSIRGPFFDSADMISGACWPDDLKALGMRAMGSWHFYDRPYNPSNYQPITYDKQEMNVASTITGLEEAAIFKNQLPWVMQFSIANMIHNFGDIHQPLHGISYYSADFPDGDMGGNKIHLSVNGEQTNLHAVWDSVCTSQPVDFERPLNKENRTKLETYAQYLIDTYGPKMSQQNKTLFVPEMMALESYNAAIEYGYNGIFDGANVTQAYLQRCLPVAEMRLALGGYRLGAELTYVFKMKTGEEFTTDDYFRFPTAKASLFRRGG